MRSKVDATHRVSDPVGVRVRGAEGTRDAEVHARVEVFGAEGAPGGTGVGDRRDDEGVLDVVLPDPGARGGRDELPLAADGMPNGVGLVVGDEERAGADEEIARVDVVHASEDQLRKRGSQHIPDADKGGMGMGCAREGKTREEGNSERRRTLFLTGFRLTSRTFLISSTACRPSCCARTLSKGMGRTETLWDVRMGGSRLRVKGHLLSALEHAQPAVVARSDCCIGARGRGGTR